MFSSNRHTGESDVSVRVPRSRVGYVVFASTEAEGKHTTDEQLVRVWLARQVYTTVWHVTRVFVGVLRGAGRHWHLFSRERQ